MSLVRHWSTFCPGALQHNLRYPGISGTELQQQCSREYTLGLHLLLSVLWYLIITATNLHDNSVYFKRCRLIPIDERWTQYSVLFRKIAWRWKHCSEKWHGKAFGNENVAPLFSQICVVDLSFLNIVGTDYFIFILECYYKNDLPG
jgi:hypothetical protein